MPLLNLEIGTHCVMHFCQLCTTSARACSSMFLELWLIFSYALNFILPFACLMSCFSAQKLCLLCEAFPNIPATLYAAASVGFPFFRFFIIVNYSWPLDNIEVRVPTLCRVKNSHTTYSRPGSTVFTSFFFTRLSQGAGAYLTLLTSVLSIGTDTC